MPSGVIAYFSQTGTTARVARAIAGGLEDAGYEIDLREIGRDPPRLALDYDVVGIGAPVHYYRLPFIVSDFLEGLPDLDRMPVFAFLMQGSYRFDAGNALRHALARKGGREVGYFHCRGEARYLGHLKEGYLFSPGHPTETELKQASAFGREVASRIATADYTPPADEPPPPTLYRLERLLLSRWLVENVYSRLFRVEPAACSACGVCMKACPTRNIGEDGMGQPVWGRNCMLCMSCEMNCPEDAISSFVSRPATRWLMRPFLRHHVRRWPRNEDFEYERVVHERGETRRLER